VLRKSSIGAKSSFHIGAALNLNMTDEQVDQEIDKYWRKIKAGAHFIMTQPIYELAPLLRFLERAGKPPIPRLRVCVPVGSSGSNAVTPPVPIGLYFILLIAA